MLVLEEDGTTPLDLEEGTGSIDLEETVSTGQQMVAPRMSAGFP